MTRRNRNQYKKQGLKSWKLSNGNVAFTYIGRDLFYGKWLFFIFIFVLCIAMIAEYYVKGTWLLLFSCLVVIFPLSLLLWMYINAKYNEKIEEKFIQKILNKKVSKDICSYGKDVKVEKMRFQIDTKNSENEESRVLLVLLTNGKMLEYEIKYHKPLDSQPFFYEINYNFQESNNKEHYKKIVRLSTRFIKWIKKHFLSEKNKMFLFVMIILFIGTIELLLLIFIGLKFKYWIVLFIFMYLIVVFNHRFIYKIKTKWLQLILLMLIYFPFRLIRPALAIYEAYFFLFIFSIMIPIISFILIKILMGVNFNIETMVLITLSSATIFSVHLSKFMLYLVKRFSPLKIIDGYKYEHIMQKLALYVLHKSNVSFIIYFVYFVYLSITGFLQIYNHSYLISESIDGSVIKAFLVFLAYTNMCTKQSETQIETKEIFSMIFNLINS